MEITDEDHRPLAAVIPLRRHRRAAAAAREHRAYVDQGARIAWDESGHYTADPDDVPYGRHAYLGDDRNLPGA